MNASQVGALTRRITTAISRRGVIRIAGAMIATVLGPHLASSVSEITAKRGNKQGKRCPSGTKRCGKSCANLQSNRDHCGGCGVQCPGGLVCLDGVCGCRSGTRCGDDCVDLREDRRHCNACGEACEAWEGCREGACVCDVCESGCEFSTLTPAIFLAAPGDTVYICPGTYPHTEVFDGTVVTLVGAGADVTTLASLTVRDGPRPFLETVVEMRGMTVVDSTFIEKAVFESRECEFDGLFYCEGCCKIDDQVVEFPRMCEGRVDF